MPAGEGGSTAAKSLGPVTEQRFAEAFKNGALASAKVAAKLVGLDVDTLSAMADAGIIRAVRKGRLRSYTEHALRAYLLDGPDAPAQVATGRRPSEKRVVRATPFSKRRATSR